VILIVFRHDVAPGTEAGFIEAWERCKAKMLGRVPGFLEASIFRNEAVATQFVSISRWESIEDWKAYWGEGVPDPEGELPKNEILVEVKTLQRPTKKTPSRKTPAKKH